MECNCETFECFGNKHVAFILWFFSKRTFKALSVHHTLKIKCKARRTLILKQTFSFCNVSVLFCSDILVTFHVLIWVQCSSLFICLELKTRQPVAVYCVSNNEGRDAYWICFGDNINQHICAVLLFPASELLVARFTYSLM